jgi:carotenoid 1,2-hydratase
LVDPGNYCALNVAIYGERAKRWSMTERSREQVQRSTRSLVIGPSQLEWDGTALTFRIDEVGAPLPRRIRGTVRVEPTVLIDRAVSLDHAGRHLWRPIAPHAHVEVAFDLPEVKWSGRGYLDSNAGEEPLETAFSHWNWSRAVVAEKPVILYDLVRRAGDREIIAIEVDSSGRTTPLAVPPVVRLPPTQWLIPRSTRADAGHVISVARTLEDTPFYARSIVSTRLLGRSAIAVHESLSLDRFSRPWVQAMLPFRMPRTWR